MRGVISARTASSAPAAGRSRTCATRTRAFDAPTAPRSPKCSLSVVTISSSGPSASPVTTMRQASLVEDVIATCSGVTPTSGAIASRTRARIAMTSSKRVFEPRPPSTSCASCASTASAVARASGPTLPAFR